MQPDPVTLALVQNRLNYICSQMGRIMMRTARSPIFSLAHDFSCFITDAKGYILSQADGLPIHTGGGGFAARALLKAFENDLNEGDAFVLSDPYAAGGNHLPDWVVARPVFVDGQLVAICCNRAHQSDIGGGAPGTYNSAATEIFHEGIRLPPLRLVERDRIREDLWDLLLLNSRAPELMNGDLRAMLGSTRIGAEHVVSIVREMGLEDAGIYFEAVLDHGDRQMRAELAALPDGEFAAEDAMNNDCFEPGEHVIRLVLRIEDEEATIDFTGTDPQVRGFKNSSIANTHSAVYVGLASFLNPELPGNEGTFRSIRLVTPEGTLVNPLPPAPMTMNTIAPGTEIIHAVWKALGQADPTRACAGWGKNAMPTMSGTNEDGSPFVMYHWAAGVGAGAVDGRDGFNGTTGLVALGALYMPDIELYEQQYPVRFIRQEFRGDSAGPGKYRGGTGIDYVVEVEAGATLAMRGEGMRTSSGFGAGGGRAGVHAESHIRYADGEAFEPPQYGILSTRPMTLSIRGASGGGWGDPLDRDPARVLRDYRDGVISELAAREVYGVVFASGSWDVDAKASEQLRNRLRRTDAGGDQ